MPSPPTLHRLPPFMFSYKSDFSIVTREENHTPILQQGALASILALTAHSDQSVRQACALVLFNFSCGSAVQVCLSAVNDGRGALDIPGCQVLVVNMAKHGLLVCTSLIVNVGDTQGFPFRRLLDVAWREVKSDDVLRQLEPNEGAHHQPLVVAFSPKNERHVTTSKMKSVRTCMYRDLLRHVQDLPVYL